MSERHHATAQQIRVLDVERAPNAQQPIVTALVQVYWPDGATRGDVLDALYQAYHDVKDAVMENEVLPK